MSYPNFGLPLWKQRDFAYGVFRKFGLTPHDLWPETEKQPGETEPAFRTRLQTLRLPNETDQDFETRRQRIKKEADDYIDKAVRYIIKSVYARENALDKNGEPDPTKILQCEQREWLNTSLESLRGLRNESIPVRVKKPIIKRFWKNYPEAKSEEWTRYDFENSAYFKPPYNLCEDFITPSELFAACDATKRNIKGKGIDKDRQASIGAIKEAKLERLAKIPKSDAQGTVNDVAAEKYKIEASNISYMFGIMELLPKLPICERRYVANSQQGEENWSYMDFGSIRLGRSPESSVAQFTKGQVYGMPLFALSAAAFSASMGADIIAPLVIGTVVGYAAGKPLMTRFLQRDYRQNEMYYEGLAFAGGGAVAFDRFLSGADTSLPGHVQLILAGAYITAEIGYRIMGDKGKTAQEKGKKSFVASLFSATGNIITQPGKMIRGIAGIALFTLVGVGVASWLGFGTIGSNLSGLSDNLKMHLKSFSDDHVGNCYVLQSYKGKTPFIRWAMTEDSKGVPIEEGIRGEVMDSTELDEGVEAYRVKIMNGPERSKKGWINQKFLSDNTTKCSK